MQSLAGDGKRVAEAGLVRKNKTLVMGELGCRYTADIRVEMVRRQLNIKVYIQGRSPGGW